MTDTLDTPAPGDGAPSAVQHDEHHDHDRHDDHHDDHGPSDKGFIAIFFFLAVVTAIEVAVSYLDIGPLFLPVLLGLMLVKFFTVVWYFMHVKFDHPLFGQLFYVGLGLAAAVYTAALATFHFFAG